MQAPSNPFTIFFLFLYGLKFIETSKGIGEDTVSVFKDCSLKWERLPSSVWQERLVFHIQVDQLPRHVISKHIFLTLIFYFVKGVRTYSLSVLCLKPQTHQINWNWESLPHFKEPTKKTLSVKSLITLVVEIMFPALLTMHYTSDLFESDAQWPFLNEIVQKNMRPFLPS